MAAPLLRIIIATPRFFPHQGGVENHVYQTARRFASLGHQVVVYTSNQGRALAEHETIDGIAVRRFASYPAGSDLYYAPGLYRAIAAAGRDCDVVHIQN